jgi:hypothetical protein
MPSFSDDLTAEVAARLASEHAVQANSASHDRTDPPEVHALVSLSLSMVATTKLLTRAVNSLEKIANPNEE